MKEYIMMNNNQVTKKSIPFDVEHICNNTSIKLFQFLKQVSFIIIKFSVFRVR